MRLDKKLTPASEVLPYPKPATDYPIKTKEHIYKQNDKVFNSYVKKEKENVEYFYQSDEPLFSRRVLIKRGEVEKGVSRNKTPMYPVAVYDIGGNLESYWPNIDEIKIDGYLRPGIRDALKFDKAYKNKYFKFYYEEEPPSFIEVPIICILDEIPFNSFSELGRYLGVSRQAVHQAWQRKAKQINNIPIHWVEN